MTRVLILGANGQLARHTTTFFLKETDATLTLFLRNARRLKNTDPKRATIIDGDVTDRAALLAAMQGQDVVYANLSGDMAKQARVIVDAMHSSGLKRLIFISSMGIYGEVPGEHYRSVLDPYRDAAQVIEASKLDYTILRPEWLNDDDEIDYGTTQKGEAFKNPSATVSRKSVADLIINLAMNPGLEIHKSLGVHKTL